MKKVQFLFVLSFITLVFGSCKKDKNHKETEYITINATVKSGDTYTLDLSQYGDADDIAAITQQPANYAVSSISKPSNKYQYTFSTLVKVAGTADAQIKLIEPQKGSNGLNGITVGGCYNPGNKEEIEAVIDIHFTITQ